MPVFKLSSSSKRKSGATTAPDAAGVTEGDKDKAKEKKKTTDQAEEVEEEKESDSTATSNNNMATDDGDKWKCNDCGYESPVACKFCGVCGSKKPEPETWWCASCEMQQPALHKFCSGCGGKQEDAVVAAAKKPTHSSEDVTIREGEEKREESKRSSSEEEKTTYTKDCGTAANKSTSEKERTANNDDLEPPAAAKKKKQKDEKKGPDWQMEQSGKLSAILTFRRSKQAEESVLNGIAGGGDQEQEEGSDTDDIATTAGEVLMEAQLRSIAGRKSRGGGGARNSASVVDLCEEEAAGTGAGAGAGADAMDRSWGMNDKSMRHQRSATSTREARSSVSTPEDTAKPYDTGGGMERSTRRCRMDVSTRGQRSSGRTSANSGSTEGDWEDTTTAAMDKSTKRNRMDVSARGHRSTGRTSNTDMPVDDTAAPLSMDRSARRNRMEVSTRGQRSTARTSNTDMSTDDTPPLSTDRSTRRNNSRMDKSSRGTRRSGRTSTTTDLADDDDWDEAGGMQSMDKSNKQRDRMDKSTRGTRRSARTSTTTDLADDDWDEAGGTQSMDKSAKRRDKMDKSSRGERRSARTSTTDFTQDSMDDDDSSDSGHGGFPFFCTDKPSKQEDQGGQLDASWRFPRPMERTSKTYIDKPEDFFADSDTCQARKLFMDEPFDPAMDFTPLVVDGARTNREWSSLPDMFNDDSDSDDDDDDDDTDAAPLMDKSRQGRSRQPRRRSATVADKRGKSMGADKRSSSAGASKRSSSAGADKRSSSAGASKRSNSAGANKRSHSAGANKRSGSAGAKKRSNSRGARKRGPSVGANKRSNSRGASKRSASASARNRRAPPGRTKSTSTKRNKERRTPGRTKSESAARGTARSFSPKGGRDLDASARGPRSHSRAAKAQSEFGDAGMDTSARRVNKSTRGGRTMDSRSQRTGRTVRGARSIESSPRGSPKKTMNVRGAKSVDSRPPDAPDQTLAKTTGRLLNTNPRDTLSVREKRSIDVDGSRGRQNQTMRAARSIDITYRDLSIGRQGQTKSVRGNRTRLPQACPLLNCSCASCSLKKQVDEGEGESRARSASPPRPPTNPQDESRERKTRSMSPKASKPTLSLPKSGTVARSRSMGDDSLWGEDSTLTGHSVRQRPSEFTAVAPTQLTRGNSDGLTVDSSWMHFSVADFGGGHEGTDKVGELGRFHQKGSADGTRKLSRQSVAERLSKGSKSGAPLPDSPLPQLSSHESLPPLIGHDSLSCTSDDVTIFRSSVSSAEDANVRHSYSAARKNPNKANIDPLPAKRGGSIVDSGMLDNSSLLDHSDASEGRRTRNLDSLITAKNNNHFSSSSMSMPSIDSTVANLSNISSTGPVNILRDHAAPHQQDRDRGNASKLKQSTSLAELRERAAWSLSPRKSKEGDLNDAGLVKQSASLADLRARAALSLSPRSNHGGDQGDASHLRISTSLADLRARAGTKAAKTTKKDSNLAGVFCLPVGSTFLEDNSLLDASKPDEASKGLPAPVNSKRRGRSPPKANDMDRSCPSNQTSARRNGILPFVPNNMKRSSSFDVNETAMIPKSGSSSNFDRIMAGFCKDPTVQQEVDTLRSTEAVNIIASSWSTKRGSSSRSPAPKKEADNTKAPDSSKRSSSRSPKPPKTAVSRTRSRSKSPKAAQNEEDEVDALAATEALGLIASTWKKSSARASGSGSGSVGLQSSESKSAGNDDDDDNNKDASENSSGPSESVSQRVRVSTSLEMGLPPTDPTAAMLETKKATSTNGESKAAMIAGLVHIGNQQGELSAQVTVAPNAC